MTVDPKPDFDLLATWARLLRGIASETAVPGRPPIAPFGPEDPAAAVWSRMDGTEAIPGILGLTRPGTAGPAPWLPETDGLAIEVWTECELAVLHAATNLVLDQSEDHPDAARMQERLDLAIAWHLEHTQPDNATGRPWAIHAFLLRGTPQAEALDYAASMLHTVEASRMPGTPLEPLMAWILADAARGLNLEAASRLSRWLR